MATNESKDYKKLKNNMVEPLDRIDRIENIVAIGMPDINYCAEGAECWIELKSPKEPKRSSTPLFGSNHKLSQDQKNWMLSQRNAKGKAYILIATDVRWALIDGSYADSINELTVEELVKISAWCAETPIKQKDKWKELRQILIKGNN